MPDSEDTRKSGSPPNQGNPTAEEAVVSLERIIHPGQAAEELLVELLFPENMPQKRKE